MLVIAVAGAAIPFGVAAASGTFLSGSLASELLQSRIQLRILKQDDAAGVTCQDRRVVDARVVKKPRLHKLGAKISERKWQEQWSFLQCGKVVSYRVFLTEVGQGGAFFSFVKMPAA